VHVRHSFIDDPSLFVNKPRGKHTPPRSRPCRLRYHAFDCRAAGQFVTTGTWVVDLSCTYTILHYYLSINTATAGPTEGDPTGSLRTDNWII